MTTFHSRLAFSVMLFCSIEMAPIHAAEPLASCTIPPIEAKPQLLTLPEYDEVRLSDGSNEGNPIPKKASGEFALEQEEVSKAAELSRSGKSPMLRLINKQDATKNCQVVLAMPVPAGGQSTAPTVAANSTDVSLSDCQAESGKYYDQIRSNRRRLQLDGAFSLVVFCGAGTAYQESHGREDGGRWGRPIYAAVFERNIKNLDFEYPNCAPEGDGPRGYKSGSLKIAGLQADQGATMTPDVSGDKQGVFRSCYNDSVDIVLRGQSPGDTQAKELNRYSLHQAKTYHYTTQLGVLFTDDVTRGYAVSDDGTGTMRIRDTGPIDDGPQYFASVVIYGLPHQLASLINGKSYAGRALQKDTQLADRLGLLIGVGLEDPGDEFVAGLTFELMAGLNITVANRWAKMKVLDGVAVGDPFTGAADTLPKQDKWEQNFSVGIAIDLRYVTSLFDRT